MKALLLAGTLLLAPAARAQPAGTLPTDRDLAAFWLRGPSPFLFGGVPTCPTATWAAQTAHLTAWLETLCPGRWSADPVRHDSARFYSAALEGFRAGVTVHFRVRLSRRPDGWHYLLGAFWLYDGHEIGFSHPQMPLKNALADPRMAFDLDYFEQQLDAALRRL